MIRWLWVDNLVDSLPQQTDLLAQAEALEAELKQLADADELDDDGLSAVLEKREMLHQKMGAAIDHEEVELSVYQPYFRQAYQNTKALLKRCQAEQSDVKERLITLNTSKKARKAY